ncbi:MAG: hypothetical protein IMY72_11895 [Bacteroidetes bacterium]|nr:hypothetical protein [Bacteroidota bacterium]
MIISELFSEKKRHDDNVTELFQWLMSHKTDHPDWSTNCHDRNYHIAQSSLIDKKIYALEHPSTATKFPETISVPKKCKNVN